MEKKILQDELEAEILRALTLADILVSAFLAPHLVECVDHDRLAALYRLRDGTLPSTEEAAELVDLVDLLEEYLQDERQSHSIYDENYVGKYYDEVAYTDRGAALSAAKAQLDELNGALQSIRRIALARQIGANLG